MPSDHLPLVGENAPTRTEIHWTLAALDVAESLAEKIGQAPTEAALGFKVSTAEATWLHSAGRLTGWTPTRIDTRGGKEA